MSFYKVNEGSVKNNKGVSIQIKHHDYLLYQENENSVEISIGYEASVREIHVYLSEVNDWNSSGKSNLFEEKDRSIIGENLTQGLKLLTGNFVLKSIS